MSSAPSKNGRMAKGTEMNYAKRIFVHYFRSASGGGWNWDSDNQVEIESAVEAIEDVLTERIRKLEERIEKLEKQKDFKY
jgi:hypothetical protein